MPYQNHIKSIYGPYMGQEPPPMLELGLCHMKPISNPYLGHIWVTPVPQIGLWTFEPAFSPRFLPTLSPRSIFSTGQWFPISNHVTSGSHEPAILFYSLVSGFPHRKCYDVILWSRDRSRPIRSQSESQTSPTYYLL